MGTAKGLGGQAQSYRRDGPGHEAWRNRCPAASTRRGQALPQPGPGPSRHSWARPLAFPAEDMRGVLEGREQGRQVSTGPQHRGWAAPTWPWRGQACCCGEANGAPNTEVNKGFSHRHRSCPREPAVSRLKGSKFCKPGHQASSTGAPRPVWAAPGARGAKTPILHYGAQAGHLSLP